MLIPVSRFSRVWHRRLFPAILALCWALVACSEAEQPAQEAAMSAEVSEPVSETVVIEEDAAGVLEEGVNLQHGFELTDMNGNTRHSDEWAGKPLLINFWATWCIPCRKEMPVLMELHEQYLDQGFEVIGIAADEPEKITAFLETTPVSYSILYGEMSSVFDLSENYGNEIGILPHTAFVDREGVIRHIKVGEISHEEAEELILDTF